MSGLTEKEEKKMSKLLEPSITYKPFNYPWAMQFAESHEKIHWGSWEAKLAEVILKKLAKAD